MKQVKLLALALLVQVCFSISSFANNYFTPGTGVKWTLDQLVSNSGGDVTFSGGVYNVNDTVFISFKDTLSITADAVVRFAANTYLDVNGTLIINPPTGVTFTAQNQAAGYLGMRIDSSNTTVLRKLTFEYANSLRLFDCSPLIENCVFRNNSPLTTFGNAAISVFRSNVVIRDCQFLNNQRAAIQGGSNIANAPIITGCLFMGNNTLNQNVPQINLGTTGNDTAKILNNQLLRASTNSGAIGFLPIGNVQALITGNIIKNNRYGITLNGGSNINTMISYNIIDSNNTQGDPLLGGSGIAFAGGTATSQQNSIVTGNTFTANLWGITIQNRSRPNLGNLTNTDTSDNGKNRFINNTNSSTPGIDLYNNSVDPIFAQGNYWNTNNPVAIENKIFHTPDQNTLGLVTYSNFITLPVAFEAFDVTQVDLNAYLSWVTSNEAGSSYFVIERSSDGQAFDSIGRVAASGTTYGNTHYSFTDRNIPYFEKLIYYRIRLVNSNGSTKSSSIASVIIHLGNRGQQVLVYPTVVTAGTPVSVVIVSDRSQSASIQLLDAAGKTIWTSAHALSSATNRVELQLPGYLPAGWYYVRVSSGNIDKTVPVLKR